MIGVKKRNIEVSFQQSRSSSIMGKLKQCREEFKAWGKIIWFQLRQKVKEAKQAIKHFKGGRDATSITNLCMAENRLNFLLLQEELYWKQ